VRRRKVQDEIKGEQNGNKVKDISYKKAVYIVQERFEGGLKDPNMSQDQHLEIRAMLRILNSHTASLKLSFGRPFALLR
jgi:hypothetical protein